MKQRAVHTLDACYINEQEVLGYKGPRRRQGQPQSARACSGATGQQGVVLAPPQGMDPVSRSTELPQAKGQCAASGS